jgi:uncharacterized protein (UPF0335 family)
MVDPAVGDELKRTFNAVKGLEEEKKSIGEDINEEKIACSKKTGLDVKDINTIFRLVKMNEKGQIPLEKFREYIDILEVNSYADEYEKTAQENKKK